MALIKYNETQIEELKKNKYVKNCTKKHIVFTKVFKFEAVKLHKEMIPKEIFKKFWFPDYVINSEIPKNSVARWEKNINNKWQIEDKKWRPKVEKIDFDNMTLEQENEYLRTKLALYEELADYMKTWLP